MVDFNALLLNPIYAALGVPAVLTLSDSRVFNITVIDKTSGVEVGNNVQVPTILPAAAIRYAEIAALGMNKNDIEGGTLEFNGYTWTISNAKNDPNPSGEKSGELIVMLIDQHELASSES